jgi:hypothetical protein
MSSRSKYLIGAVIVAIVLLFVLPVWVPIGVLVVAAAGYFALDSSQRRRLRGVSRRRLGR